MTFSDSVLEHEFAQLMFFIKAVFGEAAHFSKNI